MGERVRFKKLQRNILKVIIQEKARIVKIMPTEGEKNLIFILLVFRVRGEIIILVIPFIILKQNIKRRYKKLKIKYKG